MPICLLRSLETIPLAAKHGVVTLGNFDGMHLGHQRLLKQTVDFAKKLGRHSVVITFNPHPFEYFSGKKNVPRLSSVREKVLRMEALGIDYLIILHFDEQVAMQSASDFVKTVLYDALNAKHIMIGDDFHFGYQRQGDFELLKLLGKEYQFSVEAMLPCHHGNRRISSTWVRETLKSGDLQLATTLLGRAYSVSGCVQYGDALGRQLGFPTINLKWRKAPPLTGIYTVRVFGIDDKPLLGVASSGTRPAVGGTYPLLEVHLLDFDRTIYGLRVTIEFCHKLREEENFATLDALSLQIAADVTKTRAYFTGKE